MFFVFFQKQGKSLKSLIYENVLNIVSNSLIMCYIRRRLAKHAKHEDLPYTLYIYSIPFLIVTQYNFFTILQQGKLAQVDSECSDI